MGCLSSFWSSKSAGGTAGTAFRGEQFDHDRSERVGVRHRSGSRIFGEKKRGEKRGRGRENNESQSMHARSPSRRNACMAIGCLAPLKVTDPADPVRPFSPPRQRRGGEEGAE